MKILFFLLTLNIFISCTHVSSNVSRLHRIDKHDGKKVLIMSINDEQSMSIAFDNYKKMIADELQKYNILITTDKIEADWILLMNYGVSGSQTEVSSIPLWGQTGGGSTYNSGTITSFSGKPYTYSGTSYTTPTYGIVGNYTTSQKTFNRFLVVKIFENNELNRETASNNSLKIIFEGNVTSSGTNSHFEAVSKCLIKSLFKNFPGKVSENYTKDFSYPCK